MTWILSEFEMVSAHAAAQGKEPPQSEKVGSYANLLRLEVNGAGAITNGG